ncbi:hypothetical protein [Methylobacterium sp. CM6257]
MSGFDDPFWTSKQVVAWVAFKDRDLIDKTAASELRKLWYTDRNANRRVHRDALEEHIYLHHPTSDTKTKFRKAIEDVQNALMRGEIVASYQPEESSQRVEASKRYWIDHHFYRYGALSSLASYSKEPHNPEVRFEAKQIQRKWPIASTPVARRRAAGKAAFEALCEMMRASLNRRPASQEQIFGGLMKSIPGLSEREALKQWFRAIEETGAEAWSDPGRPANDP